VHTHHFWTGACYLRLCSVHALIKYALQAKPSCLFKGSTVFAGLKPSLRVSLILIRDCGHLVTSTVSSKTKCTTTSAEKLTLLRAKTPPSTSITIGLGQPPARAATSSGLEPPSAVRAAPAQVVVAPSSKCPTRHRQNRPSRVGHNFAKVLHPR